MNRKSAITAIRHAGALLVFPMDNRKEPASIWSHFYPKEEMRWEWDDDGDDRVAQLWHLRGSLSTTREVVYTKWFRGRATYFSRPLFTALLRSLNPWGDSKDGLSREARTLLEVLESESPLSTKEIKRIAGFRGREQERAYEKALRELWSRLLIVAYGEVEDGAFPSLAVGSTRVIFEDLWADAFGMAVKEAESRVLGHLSETNLFYRHYLKLRTAQRKAQPGRERRGLASKKTSVPKMVKFEDL